MKIVIDTNVVIDAVASRQPFCKEAEAILLMVSEGKIEGYITANSITDIFYVVRRSLTETQARQVIRSILYSLDVIDVGGEDCWQALNLQIGDFEDALIVSCAEKICADYIVSRDSAFLKEDSPVQIIAPDSFLDKHDK